MSWHEGRPYSSDTTVASFEYATYCHAPSGSPLVKGNNSCLQTGQYVSFLPPYPPQGELHQHGDMWFDFFFLNDEELEDDVFYPDDDDDVTSLPLTTDHVVTSHPDEKPEAATGSILSESFRRLELGQVDATLRKLTQNKAQSRAHSVWRRRRKKSNAASLSESSASDRMSASGSEHEAVRGSCGSSRGISPRGPHWFGATCSASDTEQEVYPSPRRRLFDYIVAHDEQGQQELHLVRRDSVRLRQWQISQKHRLKRRQNKGCRTLPRK